MPGMTEENFNKLISEIFQNGIPLSLSRTKEDENEAKRNANKYLETKLLNKKTPRTMYFIISGLNEEERIKFIKEHLEYIKENEEDIFIYTMLSPPALSYYLTYANIKDLYKLDRELFFNIIKQNHENLFHGFSHEQYMDFYKTFKKEINNIDNIYFINSLYYQNRCCYDNLNLEDVNNKYTLQQSYNLEFINMILKEYKDKIDSFNGNEIKNFLSYISDISIFEKLINEYKEKLSLAFKETNVKELSCYLSEQSEIKQEILIRYFKDVIVTKENIKIVSKLSPSIILELFNNNKELFDDFTLKDWIQLTSRKRILTQEFKDILDSYEIENIEELFDINFYVKNYFRESVDSLKYVEQNYRKKLNNKKLNRITKSTSIFSKEYLENLNYLKNNNCGNNSIEFKVHFAIFLGYIRILNIDDKLNSTKEIEILFKRIISGTPISILFEIKNINEIALINRIGDIEFDASEFTIEQLKKYNVKKHKQLNEFLKTETKYKTLTLKLMFMLGYNNAKKILEYNNELPVLEHLVGNVDVKNIKLDNQGEPIVNKRIINMLFNNNKIKEMFDNKDNELYKYFPRIFNEWEMIKINGKDKSLKTILEYLKSDEISLPPKYSRLEGLFKYIGCKNTIVTETLKLHDEILERTSSTIPRVEGKNSQYTYEIMKYDDMKSLAIGNMTDCCFTVLGVGYQCLRHALISKNGRIFVIKKDNEIIAHSWIWRNGNHICFDNIEVSKKVSKIDFMDIYIEVANKLIEETYKYEKNNCVTNITIGYTNFDKRIEGIEKYPCLVSETCDFEKYRDRIGDKKIITTLMPSPIEQVNYSDSKSLQFIIKGTGEIKLYQSEFFYEDEREEVLHYDSEFEYEKEFISKIVKIINELRYIKLEKENKLDKFEMISIFEVKEIYCNKDWYYIEYEDGYIEMFNNSKDIRGQKELEQIEKNKTLCLK